ncbi:50S ribosomal protein L5 [Desulfovermiculus halophilus]|jgi:large subunit ribosomal protein L5|uniref:50S ribosomal protein L5 n=1 Tax=Desulfovermiculus halophilus TaxID=339722 RepID=UPI0004817392|nr:50S ribosomal protein L5 [Desulfovermiculus halophilus]
MSRLHEIYSEKIAPELKKEFSYSSPMQIPGMRSISLNMGLGEGSQDNKIIQDAVQELSLIAGQQAVITRAKKSIAAFKLREGMPVGCRVTLRHRRMWEFYDKLVNFALPRVRDFRGVQDRGFDGRGNFTLGIREHTIFPEINMDKIDRVKGLNVTVVTSARTDKEGKMLLQLLGMPFIK